MTTYTTLSDTTLSQDKPVTQSVMRALRDNPLAISEGASGAPKILRNGMRTTTFTASGTFVVPSDVTQVWVEVAGGGGGGAGQGIGGAGGASSFGSVSASGGGAGSSLNISLGTSVSSGANGAGSGGDHNFSGSGGSRGCGGFSNDGGTQYIGTSGGDGGRATSVLAVTPGASISVTVGAGGSAGSNGGRAGSAGWVTVIY